MDLFLIILAGIWLVIASLQDIKKREVPNWLNFSLIAFALAYRAFYSIVNQDSLFFLYGLLGFLVFLVLAYAFYYGKVFGGGDAKLFMAIGAILPFEKPNELLFVSSCFVFLLLLVFVFWLWVYFWPCYTLLIFMSRFVDCNFERSSFNCSSVNGICMRPACASWISCSSS
jgi:preflagellin peptidase FlaK